MNATIAIANLLLEIMRLIREGKSDPEIRARLASPTGVGQALIEASRDRSSAIDDYIKNG